MKVQYVRVLRMRRYRPVRCASFQETEYRDGERALAVMDFDEDLNGLGVGDAVIVCVGQV
jgi:hypothetical protein